MRSVYTAASWDNRRAHRLPRNRRVSADKAKSPVHNGDYIVADFGDCGQAILVSK